MGVGWGKLPGPALYATSLPKACVDTWRCKPSPLRTDHNECNRLDAVSPEGKSKKLRFFFLPCVYICRFKQQLTYEHFA